MKDISVSELVKYLKYINEHDSNLFNLCVSGELSNVKIYPSKVLYFDLKDDNAKINGVMFARDAAALNFKPNAGDKVKITGSIKVYQNNATFQIIATKIEKDGYGDLFIQFEKTKKELEDAGYFKDEHKKVIPTIPKKIAVIAGHNSAALKDILTTLNNRYKLAQVVVFESLVQGSLASKQLIKTINIINNYEFDVIILARGGGSFEDLNTFNDRDLALTIFNSRIPIVTGIGHETDYTIADFVSDYRALTPTAAAIKITPDSNELLVKLRKDNLALNNYFKNLVNHNYQLIDSNYLKLNQAILLNINLLKEQLNDKKLRLEKNNIRYKIQEYTQKTFEYHLMLNNLLKYDLATKKHKIQEKQVKLDNAFQKTFKEYKHKLNESSIQLNLLDPKLPLEKGYAIVYQNDVLIKDYLKLKENAEIEILGKNAQVKAKVIEVKSNGK